MCCVDGAEAQGALSDEAEGCVVPDLQLELRLGGSEDKTHADPALKTAAQHRTLQKLRTSVCFAPPLLASWPAFDDLNAKARWIGTECLRRACRRGCAPSSASCACAPQMALAPFST